MGTYIPLPFAEITKQYAQTMNHTPITLLGVFSGANYARISIFLWDLIHLCFQC